MAENGGKAETNDGKRGFESLFLNEAIEPAALVTIINEILLAINVHHNLLLLLPHSDIRVRSPHNRKALKTPLKERVQLYFILPAVAASRGSTCRLPLFMVPFSLLLV